jgi:phage tail sheath gpL-like
MSVISYPIINAQLVPDNIVQAYGSRRGLICGQFNTPATITADTIAFADSNPDTITDTGNAFITSGFKPGQKINVTNGLNDGQSYTINTVAAGLITLSPNDVVVPEVAGTSITISRANAGSVTSGQLYQNVQANTVSENNSLFGNNSELINRIHHFIQGSGGYVQLDVIPIADASTSTPAAANLAITGTATENKTVYISVVDKYAFKLSVDIVSGDTADIIGNKVVTALNTKTRCPVVGFNNVGTVVFTATNSGTVGNFYGLEVEGAIAGITFALTGFTGGATDPTLTGIFDAAGEERYTGIGWPEWWADEQQIVIDFLEARFNPNNAILDGIAFQGLSGTFATVLAATQVLNTQVLVTGGNNVVNELLNIGQAILQPPDFALSYFMGVRDKRLTVGTPIADNVIATTGSNDAIGGPALASKPYFNTELKETPVANAANLFTFTEQAELEEAGYTFLGTNRTKNGTVMGAVTSSYTTDSAGNENISFHYLNYVDTGSVCREILFNSAKARFAQTRLTNGEIVAGRSIDNAESIKAHYMGVYRDLSELALVEKGAEAEQFVSENTTVTVNKATRLASVNSVLPIITGLGRMDYVLQFNFNLESGQQIIV